MTQFQLLWHLYVRFGAAWYWNQRTHSPYRILLELRTHNPRPTLVVSLRDRLPNPHKLGHPAIHSWLLDALDHDAKPSKGCTVLKCKRLQFHTGTNSSVMLNHLVFGLGFGVRGISSLDDFLSKALRNLGCSKWQLLVSLGAANQLVVVGVAIYSLGASWHDLT